MATRDRMRNRRPMRPAAARRGHLARPEAAEPLEPVEPAAPIAAPGGGWREEAMTASALNVIAGIWLVISPWVLGYTSADATWNPVVFGAIVIVLALVRAAGFLRATAWLAGVNFIIGGWLFASAFWLAHSGQASWNVGILGIVVMLLAAWSLTASGAPRGGEVARV